MSRIPKVKSGYKVVYHGKKFREIRKFDKEMGHEPTPKVVYTDWEDRDEINYMFGVHLTSPDARIYLVYSDGSMRRVKTHYCLFQNTFNNIRRICECLGRQVRKSLK